MKILVTTTKTQGQRENDFFWTKENELAYLGFECARDAGEADGYCGCIRSFNGIETKKGSTTALVLDMNISLERYTELFSAQKLANYQVPEMLELARHFEPGDIIEKRGPCYDEKGNFLFGNFQVRIPNG